MRRPRRDPEARVYDPRGVPTEAEQRELARRAGAGDRAARDEMVVRNYGLVVAFVGHYRVPRDLREDLIQEGICGLMRAADDYDPDRGVRFGTFATFWLRRFVGGYLADHGHAIRSPRYLHLQKHRRHPYAAAARAARRVESLDEPCDDGRPLADLIPAPEQDVSEGLCRDEERAEGRRAAAIVDGLDDPGRDVIRARFGLDGSPPETLKSIGRRIGKTGEWVRRVEGQALNRLRRLAGA